jgi:hypothetical protein
MGTQRYSSELIKGTGLVTETMTLLSVYNGQDKNTFLTYVLDNNLLSTSSEQRAKDIVKRVFFKRYVNPDPQLAFHLKAIRAKGQPMKQMKQLLFLHTARVTPVLYDFILGPFNDYKKQGLAVMPSDGALQFITMVR